MDHPRPLTAVAVSGFIVWEAVRLIRESVGDLLEASLPDEWSKRSRASSARNRA